MPIYGHIVMVSHRHVCGQIFKITTFCKSVNDTLSIETLLDYVLVKLKFDASHAHFCGMDLWLIHGHLPLVK